MSMLIRSSIKSKIASLTQFSFPVTVEDLLTILEQCRLEKSAAIALYLHVLLCQTGLDSQTLLGNHLISIFLDIERVCLAQQVFDKLVFKNERSWSRLILGYSNYGKPQQTIHLYERMVKAGSPFPNEYAVVALLKACIELKDLETGQTLFAEIARQGLSERNIYINSTLVNMYANCHEVALAQEVIDKFVNRNVVSWNALISGYTDHGCGEEALSCLQRMWHEGIAPDVVTLVCCLKACGSIVCLSKGQDIHSEIMKKGLLEDNIFVASTLVNMYIKCGAMETACHVFERLPPHNTVMWNALISGYADCGQSEESLDCLKRMLSEGFGPDDVTFVSALKSCSNLGSISMGQEVHCDILLIGMENNPVVGCSLVDMYTKCGYLTHAEDVFGKLPVKDMVAWTALIAGYVDQGDCVNALHRFAKMHSERISPSTVTFSCLLKACSTEGAKSRGLELFAEATRKGFESEPLVSRSAVDFYAKCGLLTEAQNVFDMLLHHDVFCSSALIVGYIEQGLGIEALNRFKHMQKEGAVSDVVTLVCVLKACAMIGATDDGQRLHADLCKKGLEINPIVSSTLADMYAKCGFFEDAERVCDRTIASWNALISGLTDHGHDEEALNCFKQVEHEGFSQNALTFVFGLKACCSLGAIVDGQNIYAELVKKGLEMDLLISNTLIDMYAKSGLLSEAVDVFCRCSSRTAVLWSAILAGCIEHGHGEQALEYFDQMQQAGVPPSAATFSCVLRACGNVGAVEKGEEILTEIVKKGMLEESTCLGGTLVDMYAKQGYLAEAQNAFNKLSVQDAVAWTVLIAGYVEHGAGETALTCFAKMQFENVLPFAVTFISMLKVCSRMRALDKAQIIHLEIVRRGMETEPYIGNTLVDMYAKCGLLAEARKLFNDLPVQNIVTWTALIKGYVEAGSIEEAWSCFEQMEQLRISQGVVTLVGRLKACASISALARGQETHSEIAKRGLDEEPTVGNTLVDLYAKSGTLAEAEDVFCRLSARDLVSWTSVMVGYSQVGKSEDVIRVFDNMVGEGIKPDAITFIAILNALSHTGLAEEGQMYFKIVCSMDGFIPSLEHYTSLVDLLGRSGLIEKAVTVAMEMPVHPGMVVWLTLMGACRKWGYLDSGRDAFQHAVSLNKEDSAPYVSLANIHAECYNGNELVLCS